MNKERFTNFDYLRGCATLAVIIIHITAPMTEEGDALAISLNQLSRFAVPSFLMLSGWGLDMTNALERADNYWEFLRHRIQKILPQYLVWSVFYALYNFWLAGESLSLTMFGQLLLRGKLSYHLYFVPLIIGLYAIYPLLDWMAKQTSVFIIFNVLFIFQHISDDYLGYIPYDNLQNFYTYLFVFAYGIWLSQDFEAKLAIFCKERTWIYVITFVFTLFTIFESLQTQGQTVATTRPFVTFYSMALIMTFMVLDLPSNRGIMWLSQHSYLIYLSHVLLLNLQEDLVDRLNWRIAPVIYIPATLALVLVGEKVLVSLKKYFPKPIV